MQKITHIIILSLISLLVSQSTVLAQTPPKDAVVTFGKYPDCIRGRSICTVKSPVSQLESNARVVYNSKSNTLVLSVFKAKLSQEAIDNILEGGKNVSTFVIEDTLRLDLELKHTLGIPETIVSIPKGHYPMEVNQTIIKITIKL